MKTKNCVYPNCNEIATSYCGCVKFGKEKILAGLCDKHADKAITGNLAWMDDMEWKGDHGLKFYNTTIENPVEFIRERRQYFKRRKELKSMATSKNGAEKLNTEKK